MRRRARTDANQTQIVAALRAVGVPVFIASHVGGGFPDLVCGHPRTGHIVFLEVKDGAKSASRRRLTPAEESFAARFPVHVVETVDQALAVFGIGRA